MTGIGGRRVKKARIVRWSILVLLIVGIGLVRENSSWGEWYALHLYPVLSTFFSFFSSCVPFSLGDLFILLIILGGIAYVVYGLWKRRFVKHTLVRLLEGIGWIYVWFYMAWGINYFREDFYTRSDMERVHYTPENFQQFLENYLTGLNTAYESVGDSVTLFNPMIELQEVATEIKNGYREIDTCFGLLSPRESMVPKSMLFSRMMSKMAILGYAGPFFSEFNLNAELPFIQYPSCYAHELAHRLGIASEAEANLYAYLVCIRSSSPLVRFSGYFSLLGYVMQNARNLLSESDFKKVVKQLNPGIVALHKEVNTYWRSRYSTWIGNAQEYLYNLFLKGNQVRSGVKNYSEVIGLLISYEQYQIREIGYPDLQRLEKEYLKAVEDARKVDSTKLWNGLIPIIRELGNSQIRWLDLDTNQMLLVVSMMGKKELRYWPEGDEFKTSSHISWVVLPFELRQKMDVQPLKDSLEVRMRMLQLLGLPPTCSYDMLVFFWVKKEGLRRPSRDPEIDDTVASLNYTIHADKDYREWFEQNILRSYTGNPPYPWTQMGYTYDWNDSADRYGVSEFIVWPETLVKVEQILSCWQYYKQLRGKTIDSLRVSDIAEKNH
ncbi:DUF3810 domain-containing protein [uncultured Sanguibacteroides sp.]|uniref:DUF3810 domain-containing protein n=1 Tax=uncultured Sanguibacteroides sp. TaxID=1635151 RepID=UPI0025D08DE7|nr:DUF3810 domain-containing protein [uncultured Sanguibacteroides sp.]